MKTSLIYAISSGLFSLMVIGNADAQKPKSKVLPQVTISSANSSVSQRVLKNFSKSYADATNVRWMELEKRYLVKFDENDMKHHALYMKGGYKIYQVGYGEEKDLPAKFQEMIKSNYEDYNVSRVFDVDQDNHQAWIVNLLSSKKIVTAVIQDGELREISRDINGTPINPLLSSMLKTLEQMFK
jgi:hypothetical protein